MSQLKKGVMYLKAFLRMSKQFLDVYILHYLQKNGLSIFKYKRHIMESRLLLGTWFWVYFTNIDGQRITQFIYVALLCWTVNNAMVLFFKVYVGQWLTQVIFYSVLDSEYRLISFKTWICLLIICFLFCDGVCSCSTPPNFLLMFLFNSFCLGNNNKSLI